MLFSSDIACAFKSSDKAIVVQQLKYWLEKPIAKTIEGRRWIYNSIKQWHNDNFPYWSESKVRRNFEELEAVGVIITGVFNKAGFDRTKWYSLDEEKLDEIVDNYFNKSTENADTTHLSKNENDLVKMNKSIRSKRTNANTQNEQMDLVKMSRPIPETTRDYPENTSVDYLSQETGQDSHEEIDDLSSKDNLRVEEDKNKSITDSIILAFKHHYKKFNEHDKDFKPITITKTELKTLVPIAKQIYSLDLSLHEQSQMDKTINYAVVHADTNPFRYMVALLKDFIERTELEREQNDEY